MSLSRAAPPPRAHRGPPCPPRGSPPRSRRVASARSRGATPSDRRARARSRARACTVNRSRRNRSSAWWWWWWWEGRVWPQPWQRQTRQRGGATLTMPSRRSVATSSACTAALASIAARCAARASAAALSSAEACASLRAASSSRRLAASACAASASASAASVASRASCTCEARWVGTLVGWAAGEVRGQQRVESGRRIWALGVKGSLGGRGGGRSRGAAGPRLAQLGGQAAARVRMSD